MDIPLVAGQVYSAAAAHRSKVCPCLVASEEKSLGRGERREQALPYWTLPLSRRTRASRSSASLSSRCPKPLPPNGRLRLLLLDSLFSSARRT